VSRGVAGWSAEMRIAETLLGGWKHDAGVMLLHTVPGMIAPAGRWPLGAMADVPGTWAEAVFGELAPMPNLPPRAVTGLGRMLAVRPGEIIFLDGSGSYDPEGAPLQYVWSQLGGPAVVLNNAASSTPSFVAGELGGETVYRFGLVVSDGELESERSDTTVTLVRAAPAAEVVLQTASMGPQGGMTISLIWPGAAGDLCRVQASQDLFSWEDLGFTHADYLGRLIYHDLNAGLFPRRYYRGVGVPSAIPGPRVYALEFDGENDSVDVPHHASLNAFPLTLSAWIRTTNTSASVRGVAGKYVDGSLNGYALFLYEGRLRAWYFRNAVNAIFDGNLGLDGGFVADGQMHHVALVVDSNGGRLYVDGTERASRSWGGNPGPTTSSAQLRMGRYDQYLSFEGLIDEVSVWNRALTGIEIADISRQPLTGLESGLVAWWPLDDGGGAVARDQTGNGHDGVLQNGPVWTDLAIPWP
jgi:hypothetical protein